MPSPQSTHQVSLRLREHKPERPDQRRYPLDCNNYATRNHPKVSNLLVRRPSNKVHYTPTYASWLNQVERWAGLIVEQAIRFGSFTSVPELVGPIKRYAEHYNLAAQRFIGTATTEPILAKMARLCGVINGPKY